MVRNGYKNVRRSNWIFKWTGSVVYQIFERLNKLAGPTRKVPPNPSWWQWGRLTWTTTQMTTNNRSKEGNIIFWTPWTRFRNCTVFDEIQKHILETFFFTCWETINCFKVRNTVNLYTGETLLHIDIRNPFVFT